jgi:type II secretory pathway pseudopilin PulG
MRISFNTKINIFSPHTSDRKAENSRPFCNTGFSLPETLVAISILVMIIAGILSLISQGIKSASFFKNQTTAFYLASEAIEFIRNKRDSNSLSENPWLQGLSNCIGTGCIIDVRDGSINNCPGGSCPPLKYDSESNLYNYAVGNDTSFIRRIILTNIASNEIEIKAEVSWSGHFGNKNFTLKEYIFDWQ